MNQTDPLKRTLTLVPMSSTPGPSTAAGSASTDGQCCCDCCPLRRSRSMLSRTAAKCAHTCAMSASNCGNRMRAPRRALAGAMLGEEGASCSCCGSSGSCCTTRVTTRLHRIGTVSSIIMQFISEHVENMSKARCSLAARMHFCDLSEIDSHAIVWVHAAK